MHIINKEGNISELIALSENTSHDIICIQEHRIINDSVTKEHSIGKWKLYKCSSWRNNSNSVMGVIGILLNNKAYKTFIRVKMVSDRIMIAYLHGNPMTTITACYSPTNYK